MKKIKINVPTKWEDITIKQYNDFIKLFDSKKSDRIKSLEGVSIFCKVPVKTLKKVFMKDIEKAYSLIVKMTNTGREKIEMKKHIEVEGKTYSLIPNMSEMSTGEFIDLEHYCDENLNNNLHKLMSILYRPLVGKVDKFGRYEIEPYDPDEEKDKKMLNLTMDIPFGVLDFFFRLETKLLADSNNYLEKLK
ncbi:MAG: hypothetical protein Unbinned3987contig1001_39 [Prokaryotic dsDNA virus sp.]|jgi:hypothetical protein|nr:MAG: hypothetical protein Unbinned3987contig1001_39 [Prokaryotic dsDNA virus sp.]|tara:strand:- start:9515 stop:10087 length:573 start_codon:yes stop_codon:yes gene_type:complete